VSFPSVRDQSVVGYLVGTLTQTTPNLGASTGNYKENAFLVSIHLENIFFLQKFPLAHDPG
jgi:hypothetical protein